MRVGYNSGALRLQNFENSDISFFLQTTEQVTFKADGKVGIGQLAPDELLHVEGKVKAKDGFCIGDDCITEWATGDGGGGGATSIDFGAQGYLKMQYTDGGYSGLEFSQDSTARAFFGWDDSQNRFDWYAGGGSLPHLKMVMLEDGKVGIGSYNPKGALHVNAKSSGGTKFVMEDHGHSGAGKMWFANVEAGDMSFNECSNTDGSWCSSKQRVTLMSGGNVGIGTPVKIPQSTFLDWAPPLFAATDWIFIPAYCFAIP